MEVLVPVVLRNLDIPIFIETGHRLTDDLSSVISKYNLQFQNPLFLHGGKTYKICAKNAIESFPVKGRRETVTKSDEEEVQKVEALITRNLHDVIIGIGGGKVLDVGKLAAAERNVGFISVPTIPSNDGIASPVAVISKEGENRSIRARVPMGIVVDLDVLRKAPRRHLRAGVGDLLANLSAIHDWRLAFDSNKDNYDPFAALLSRLAVEGLVNYDDPDFSKEGFIEHLAMGLILSGIAMGIAGSSRPASGSEHEISHAIDHLYGGMGLHGEQVAITTRFSLYLQGQDSTKVAKIYQKLKIPEKLSDINLSIDRFVKAVQYAPKTRPDRYTILEKLNLNAKKIKETAIGSGIWSVSD
ncbi:MAG TPA: iron-containing alcohol dehydrogenase [bacterium (Candidatus Stahlbacteria)]|nr:iron-containing alcohol dehydrogenase [Candidatus Stahlbacteria bacterium]